MVSSRTFHIVWVREGHGIGGEAEPSPDRQIVYKGRAVQVQQTP
jgi:hypothetical protein